jgi:hypothetical protein
LYNTETTKEGSETRKYKLKQRKTAKNKLVAGKNNEKQ